MNFLLITSMYRFVFTVTGRLSACLNQYRPIMPLRPNAHQTVTGSDYIIRKNYKETVSKATVSSSINNISTTVARDAAVSSASLFQLHYWAFQNKQVLVRLKLSKNLGRILGSLSAIPLSIYYFIINSP